MEPPALAAGPAAPVRAAPGAPAALLLPLPLAGTKPFTYRWSRAGATLDDRFTSSEDAGGVRLSVSAAQTGDSGVYTLQASNAAGSDTSKIRLEVSAEEAPVGEDPPAFLRRLQDLTVKVGSRTRFLVEIISSTECKVTWYRNERRLLEAERVALARDGNFWCADVAAVSVDDAGRWTCTAENAGGRASCSAHLNVLVPKAYKRPEFMEELRALLTEQGTVSLECKVVGVPTPVLRWFKDSREIKAGDVFALTANAEDPTSLGTYTCEAVNCMGRAYSSSKVHVVGRASREGSARPSSSGMTPEPPPIFTKELEDAHVKICEHLTLGCHIVVPPWPRSVVWYNKEGKVEPGERYHAQEDGVGGYLLEIPSTEWADEGEWKCVATSAGGRVGISTCYVAMDVPKNYRKPRFMENLQAVLTEEGLVSFECKVVGFPTPVLSWFKDGQELKPGDVYQLTGTNSLGSYCCIARNCMGKASSSAELTVEDIQNQLNEEEKLQLFSKNQAPKFIQGLKSVEAKIDEPFRFIVKVAIPPEPSVLWYRDDQPVDETNRCHLEKEDKGIFNLDIQNLEFLDQAEWKCVAMNDFGHSVTSCFLKLIIPRHYKKPRFLENLQAILSDEGAVNLECKVIGVPQPILKWYKDGEELKPGDIHRIISGQDGTCCLGTYTCEAQNCMGIAASSASLLGFDDSMKAKAKKTEEQALQRNLSLSTIHEERTSQMYDTPVGDITLDDKGEISFSFDGKEVSVSLYETPDLTEEEALQIVEMYADQLSENVTEHNVVELPPLRFVKETSTSGNLLMEAIIIDVSPEYFPAPDERTEADVEDLSIADENGPPQLSLDQDIEDGGEDYLQKTMALLSDDRSDFAAKSSRKKSDSQRSIDDFYSLSRDQSLSEEKRDDDTHVSESELQSFASARSSAKIKSKSSKPSDEPSEVTKTILMKEEAESKLKKEFTKQQESEVLTVKPKRERRTSRGSRRSSTSSERSIGKSREELLRLKTDLEQLPKQPSMDIEEFRSTMSVISTSLSKVINDVQLIERDIILKSELMASAATASRSLEIIGSLITPLSEINSIADAAKESVTESREVASTIFNSIPQPLKALQQSLTIIEKCIDMESDNKTLVKKTCVAFIETCGTEIQKVLYNITCITSKDYLMAETKIINEIDSVANEITTLVKLSTETIKARNLLTEASEIKHEEPTLEVKHLRDTQKAVFELKTPLNSLLRIVENAENEKITDLVQTKNNAVIMHDMSASIQDLQTALEQIESLSVKESSSNLQKHNTEIIETVMESVLKLRNSFELLSIEPNIEEEKEILKHTLKALKENLTEISLNINAVDEKVGQFDVLQSENKLEILQKMAQILITLENNLPRLEYMLEVKSNLDTFHKNLTKVLENVIESNDAKKYVTLMEICDTVNIINSSIKNLDSENILPLASLSNSLKIIRNNFVENVFESELNCSLLDNISDILLGIEEAINKAEEVSLQIESENIKEMSTPVIDMVKVNVILEQIDQTIAAVNTIKIIESTQELRMALAPTLENICPILEELRRCVASVRTSGVEQDEHISEISDTSLAQTLVSPLCELNQNIIILNQIIVENIEEIKDKTEIITAIAEPLHELHTTLEIIQHDVISQYGDLTPYEVSVNMASVVQNLQSCIVMIHEQAGVDGTDDMSTLEDISGIKTSADTLPSDRLVLPTAEETAIEQSFPPSLIQEIATTATAQTLQTLNEHITVLQSPEVIEALDTLSEVSDYSSLKSVVVGLGDLHAGLQGILHPVPIEGSIDLEDLANLSKLAAIAEPMQDIQQSLSVLDTSNIPIYENILDLPTEKVHSVFQSISEFKKSLEQCMNAVLPAMEITNNTIEISNKVSTLREVCEQLKDIFETSKDELSGTGLPSEINTLENVVDSLINATDVSKEIRIDLVKSITEELYSEVMKAQEDIIQFTAQTPEKLSQEAKLIQIVSDVQNNIAALEQYDFIDLTHASDITTVCVSPQIAFEIDSEALTQVYDIAENAVDVLHDSYQEIPLADLMIVEDFFKTCKNEFTILRCLISKATSHKKIIRLLQEFSSLQVILNNFTTKRSDLYLSDEVNECLTTYLILANECLRNARSTLIKVINTQSDMLIQIPISQMESIHELKHLMKSEQNNPIGNVVKILIECADVSKSITDNLQRSIINELSQAAQELEPRQNETVVVEKLEELAEIVDAQSTSCLQDLGASSKIIFNNLIICINKHQDFKDAIGTGKTLIAIKCLAECVKIVKQEFTETKMSIDETAEVKDNILKDVLTEMLQPLQALQAQLVNIQEQVLAGAKEDSISIDITTTESIMQTMTELHKDIVQQIESDKATIDIQEIDLIKEVDKEIHTIQDSIMSMDNVQATRAVKEITKPIEDIEKSLQDVLSTDTVDKTLSRETTSQLLDTIDQYIELIEIVEEISAVIKIEDVKETFNIARELKQIISAPENLLASVEDQEKQTRLALELQTALSALHAQVLDCTQELAPVLNADALQRIAQVTAQLQANLVTVTGVRVVVQAPVSFIKVTTPVESATAVLSSVSETVEIMKVEETVQTVQESTTEELVEIHTEKDFAAIATKKSVKSETEPSSKKESKTMSRHILETPQESDEKIEEVFMSLQENLMQHINEYVSEDIIEVTKELSSIINSEELKQSIVIAKELRENFKAIEISLTEEATGCDIEKKQEHQTELTQGLQSSLSCLSETTLEHLHELAPFIDIKKLEKVLIIAENLKTDLETIKVSQPVVLQAAIQEEHKVGTEFVTAQVVNESIEGTAESSLAWSLALVEPVSISTAVVEPTECEKEGIIVEEIPVNIEIKQDLAVELTSICIEDEAITSAQSKTLESDQQISQLATKIKTVDINQQELVEQMKDDLITDSDALQSVVVKTSVPVSPETEEVTVSMVSPFPILTTKPEEKAISTTTVAKIVSVSEAHCDAIIGDENSSIKIATELLSETVTLEKNLTETPLPVEKLPESLSLLSSERSHLIQQIDAFISVEVTEIVDEIANITNIETLKESVAMAKQLRESVVASDYSTTEETSVLNEENKLEQARLAQTLQDALSTLHTQALDSAQVIAPIISSNALQKISEIITHLQDHLAIAIVSEVESIAALTDFEVVDETEEQNSMVQLENLLNDVNIKINLTSTEKTTDTVNSESLKDTLDEIQTVIIKLKREYDDASNDTFNESLEDLECCVRSVQLQINEESPPELLSQACATLQLLVDNMNATQQVQASSKTVRTEETENIIEKCCNETDETVKLLDIASKFESKGSSNLASVVNNLNVIRSSLKSLRDKFLIDADTVIENGIEIVQCLDQIEENIFSSEKDIETSTNVAVGIKDSILTAVHSVYGSISNMRSTVSSVQKRYMFENYGKPSESLLHSIKNITVISVVENDENKLKLKKLSKSLRKVLNHFEDIKFYINLDKTARLPSDAAFTKIILEELKDNIFSILVPRAVQINPDMLQRVNNSLICVERNLKSIELDSSIEVKNKIPMFKEIAAEILKTTTCMKKYIGQSKDTAFINESQEIKEIVDDSEITQNLAKSEEQIELMPITILDTPSTSKQAQYMVLDEPSEILNTDSLHLNVEKTDEESAKTQFQEIENKENVEKTIKETDTNEGTIALAEITEKAEHPTLNQEQTTDKIYKENNQKDETDNKQKLEEGTDAKETAQNVTRVVNESEKLHYEEEFNQQKQKQANELKQNQAKSLCLQEVKQQKLDNELHQGEAKELAENDEKATHVELKGQEEQVEETELKLQQDLKHKKEEENLVLQKNEGAVENLQEAEELCVKSEVRSAELVKKQDEKPCLQEKMEAVELKQKEEGELCLTKGNETADLSNLKHKQHEELGLQDEQNEGKLAKKQQEGLLQKETEKLREIKETTLAEQGEQQDKKENFEFNQDQEEGLCLTNEKEADKLYLQKELDAAALKQEEEIRLHNEKEAAKLQHNIQDEEMQLEKVKEKAELNQKKMDENRLQKEQEAAESKQKEEDKYRLQKEKETTECKQRQDEENRLQKQEDGAELKEIQDEKLSMQKEKDMALSKEQEEQSLQIENETTDLKQKEIEKLLPEHEKKAADLKQKEDERQLQKEKKGTEYKQEQEDEYRLQKEQEDAEFKLKQDEEIPMQKEIDQLKQKEEEKRIQKENETAELKEIEEDERHLYEKNEAAKIKEKQDEEIHGKEKEATEILVEEGHRSQIGKEVAELNQKEMNELYLREKKEAAESRQYEEEELTLQNEKEITEFQENQEKHLILEEKEEAADLKQMEEEDLVLENEKLSDKIKQKEEKDQRSQKEKEESELKQKLEVRHCLEKDKEVAEKQKEELASLQEKEAADSKLKEEEEICLKKGKEADELKQRAENDQSLLNEEEEPQLKENENQRIKKEKDEREESGLKENENQRIQKEKDIADLKQKAEEEICLQKEKQLAELKQNQEEEIVLQQKKEAVDLKQKGQKEISLIKDKETDELKQIEEENHRLQKEKEESELKVKGNQRKQNEKEVADLKQKEMTEAKQKQEEEFVLQQKIEAADLKQMEEEVIQLKKEKETNDLKLKEEKDQRLQKEREQAELKENKNQRIQKVEDVADFKQKEEEEICLQKEKQLAELKQKQEEELILQQKKEADDLKQKAKKEISLMKEKEAELLKQKEEEAQSLQKAKEESELNEKENQRVQNEKEVADLKQNKMAKAKQKQEEENVLQQKKEAADLKQKEEKELSPIKEKEADELKRKEEEAQRLQKEKEEFELKQKENQRMQNEKEVTDLKQKNMAEAKQKQGEENVLQQKKEGGDLKQKEDKDLSPIKEKEADELKQKEEEAQRLQKEKEEFELKQKENQRMHNEIEVADLKQKEMAEAKQKQEDDFVLQQKKEAANLIQKEEKEIRLKKEEEAAELKQKEEKDQRLQEQKEQSELKENENRRIQKEKDVADLKQKEEEEICLQKEKQLAELKQKQEEEIVLQQKKEAADLKQKGQKEISLIKDKETDELKQTEEENHRLQKEKEESELKELENQRMQKEKEVADIKQIEEEKLRLQKEKELTELKQRQEEEFILQQNKEADELKRNKKNKLRLKKEKEASDLKQKEDDDQRMQKEKEASELIKKEEEARRIQKEKQVDDLKQMEQEDLRLEKEKAASASKLKQKEEVDRRLQKEKELSESKQKEEEDRRIQKENEAADLKQKEMEALRLQNEKTAFELKQNEVDDLHLQKEKEVTVSKQREEEDFRLPIDKEAAESKQKQDEELRFKKEQEIAEIKQKQEVEHLQKEIEAAEMKQKEDEVLRLQKEKDSAELKHKEKNKFLQKKEKDMAELNEKQRLKQANEAAELKEKLEKELLLQKKREANELKQKRKEELQLQKKKAEAELKQKEEDDIRIKIEAEAMGRKQKQDDEHDIIKKKEAVDLKQEDINELHLKKEKEAAELKQKEEEELRLKREKDEAELKEKEKGELRLQKDKEISELKQKQEDVLCLKYTEEAEFIKKQKEELRLKKEKDNLEQKQKEEIEANVRQQNERIECDKEEAELQLKQEVELRLKYEKEELASKKKTENAKKFKRDTEIKQNENTGLKRKEKAESRSIEEKTTTENSTAYQQNKDDFGKSNTDIKPATEETPETSEILTSEDKMYTKIHKIDEMPKKSSKHAERLDNNERRDEELHVFKNDSQENGDASHKGRREVSHEQHYIKEYQYEASQTSRKVESREKPRFVDHNHRDYTMEFARPSGYRDRHFDTDKTESLSSHEHLGRNATIFKAQTLVLDAQLRSSAPPHPEISISRIPEPTERRSEIRHERRSKARSEARSTISEKRTALTRDSKRKPVFSTYLTDRTAVEGSRVKLTCSVLSSSDPTVTWYKNGVIIDNKLKYRTKIVDGLVTLEVLNAIPSDSAEYSCTISNENGSVNSSANLKVYPSFEASPIPPTFTRSIRDTYHMAENELVLECRIRGQPLPTITWLKDDKPITGNSRYQAYYLADGVCRLAIEHPTPEDSGKYTCKAENSVWSDEITHVVNFTGKENRVSPNIATIEKSRFNRQAMESRRPHFTNVLSDYKVVQGGTIGLQVEIRGAPTRVEWLREGCSVTEVYRNAKTFVEQGLYTLALSDVTEKESGMYTCRAWSSQSHVDMNAAITVVQPNELDGRPAIIVGRPEKDILISVGEDVNISFRVQGEPKPKVVFMKGIRDITTSQRVCKMTSDDYVKFTLKRSVIADGGTYCILARNAYGCDRAFVTVVIRQRASSDNLISDWTYPTDDTGLNVADRKYKSVPERIPGVPTVVEGGNNWLSLAWPKSEPGPSAPVLAYKVESWLIGKEGGARWTELGITPLTSFDAFNLKQGEEYHFRVTPRNRYGWGESVQTPSPISVGSAGDRPEFSESLPGQLKVLVGTTAVLSCCVKGKPVPEVVWMKNGHEIEDEDRRLSSSFNGFNCCLTIKDINIEDEARYSCEAANVHGRASTYARLAVVTDRSIWEADAKLKRERSADVAGDFPPQFTMRLRDRRVQATYPVRLTCQVIGGPHPAVTWFRDGEPVKLDLRRNHFQDEHFHTLEIAPTNLEDGGVYEVMARNSSGAVSCHCSLVVDKGIRAYVAPEFCCGLEPLYKLKDGEELRITAVVEAYPSVGVTWYRDGVRLRPSRRTIMTLDRDGQIELALAAVTSRDAGVYTCTASNEVGRASTSGKVEVTGTNVVRTPPVFIAPDEPYSKEPMFIRKPRSSEAREGDTVIIACEVVGDPKPDVYWLRDFLKPDYYRDATHFKRVGDGPEYRFEIPHAKLDYTGAYSVVAKNQYGEAKAIISLQILAKDPSSSDDAHNISYGRVEVLPRFSKDLTDLLSCDGDVVEFECRLSGNPEPTIKWFHYHELIRDSDDFETIFDDGAARLKIKQVTAEDEGTYTCEAANNLGKATSSACLVVYPPGEPNTLSQRLRRPPAFLSAASTPRSTPRSTPARSVSRTPGPEPRRLCSPARTLGPAFYTYPFNKVAEEGETVTLQCAIKGNPAPWATWDKDGVILTPSARVTIKEKEELRMIEIEEISADDVGVYRITIENEFGRQEATARIEVITQRGKFYAGVRAVSPSPRKSMTYRSRRPSTPRQD